MAAITPPQRAPMRPRLSKKSVAVLMVGALALGSLAVQEIVAQVEGDRGISPVAASLDITVGGIEVDVTADNAEEARQEGWREAQRLGWKKLGGPAISDSQLQGLVTAVVIEQERTGPRRYVARLGITFDRQRAGRLLGRSGEAARSAPLLLMPVTLSAGTATTYEMRNPWQRAWAEFQAGSSRIDYVRPSGAGGDSLLINSGQLSRRSRTWWRNILDQFSASDVLIAIANLQYQYPGGPIEGSFTARYGPDNRYLARFTMTAANDRELPAMLDQAVLRFDTIFERALAAGMLAPDPTLNLGLGEMDPAIQRLIELGRAADANEAAQRASARRATARERTDSAPAPVVTATPTAPAVIMSSFVVQFATPDVAAVDATLASVRSAPGVRGAATSSLALGGTSVMRVTYGGSLAELAAALRERGFTVRQGSNALAISR